MSGVLYYLLNEFLFGWLISPIDLHQVSLVCHPPFYCFLFKLNRIIQPLCACRLETSFTFRFGVNLPVKSFSVINTLPS